jgi:hypothetical protein
MNNSSDVLYRSEEMYKGFKIVFEALIEYTTLEEVFPEESEEEIHKMYRDIDRCDSAYFSACVTAYLTLPNIRYNESSEHGWYEKIIGDVELSSEYLGCCYYNSYEEFVTTYKNDYYADMRETVVNESRKMIKSLCQQLNALVTAGIFDDEKVSDVEEIINNFSNDEINSKEGENNE